MQQRESSCINANSVNQIPPSLFNSRFPRTNVPPRRFEKSRLASLAGMRPSVGRVGQVNSHVRPRDSLAGRRSVAHFFASLTCLCVRAPAYTGVACASGAAAYACGICGGSFATLQSLASRTRSLHSVQPAKLVVSFLRERGGHERWSRESWSWDVSSGRSRGRTSEVLLWLC